MPVHAGLATICGVIAGEPEATIHVNNKITSSYVLMSHVLISVLFVTIYPEYALLV